MGHFDNVRAVNLFGETVTVNDADTRQLSVDYVKREAVPAALTAGAHTITIAEIKNGVLRMDPEAARDFTLPTAELAVAGCPGCVVGDSIDFCIINEGTAGADETISVVTAAGATLIGNMDVENPESTHDAFSSGSGLFRLQFTNVTDSSESYTLLRLA